MILKSLKSRAMDFGNFMKIFDEIKIQFPPYLTEESKKELFAELEDYPNNLKRIYTSIIEEGYVFQGDGIRNLPVINLPETKIENSPVLILSNTCDTEPNNKRDTSPRLIYSPIRKLSNYAKYLKSKSIKEEKINQYFDLIRKQEITNKLYLPQGAGLEDECVVLLDYINNCDISVLPVDKVEGNRIFSLSTYGFYILLIKISIHFTRLREGVNRRYIE